MLHPKLLEALGRAGLRSLRELASAAGLSANLLHQCSCGSRLLSDGAASRVADVLGLNVQETRALFAFPAHEEERRRILRTLGLDEALSDEQLAALRDQLRARHR